LDATAWVAIAGIVATLVGTLAGAIFGPVITEIVRRKSVRKERLLELRLAAYEELLKVSTQFVNNAATLASMHDVDIKERDENELRDLLSQVKLVASKDVVKQVNTFTEQVTRFHRDVFLAKLNYRTVALRNPEDDSALDGVRSVDRVAFGRKADALRDAYNEIEAAIRKDVQP
jgi:hypothetical protein